MIVCEEKLSWDVMEDLFMEFDVCCYNFDVECIKWILFDVFMGYLL